MMIHFRDTSADISMHFATLRVDVRCIPSTFFAMMGPGGLHSFAFPTPPLSLPQYHILAIILIATQPDLPYPSSRSRIHSASPIITPPDSQHEAIEPQRLAFRQWSRINVIEEVLRRVRQKKYEYGDTGYGQLLY